MVKENQVAYGVRVVLNDLFEPKCKGDEYLRAEPVLFIDYHGLQNDAKGPYVFIKGGSQTTSGYVYLDQIDLAYPVSDKPMYQIFNGPIEGYPEWGCSHNYAEGSDKVWRCVFCKEPKKD
jgi:hypothetical protein